MVDPMLLLWLDDKKKKKNSPVIRRKRTLHIDDGNEWYENLGSDVQTYDSEAGVQTTGEEIPDASDYSNGGIDDTILI